MINIKSPSFPFLLKYINMITVYFFNVYENADSRLANVINTYVYACLLETYINKWLLNDSSSDVVLQRVSNRKKI